MTYACGRAVGRAVRWTPLNIASMIVGFVLFWPIGLFILFYILNGGDMGHLFDRTKSSIQRNFSGRQRRPSTTGNAAFDDYREETLRRLEEEQAAFESFMERLRRARDKAEFDQFMAERSNAKTNPGTDTGASTA